MVYGLTADWQCDLKPVVKILIRYLIRFLSCVNSLMYQSSGVGTKGFGTIAANEFIYISVFPFFMSFKGSLVRQELATLRAWNLLIILLQHLVVTKVAQHARGAVGVIVGQHLETDLANDFRFVLGVSMKEVPYNT